VQLRDVETDCNAQRVGATENAGLENAAPDCRGGKRGSSTVWKAEVSVTSVLQQPLELM